MGTNCCEAILASVLASKLRGAALLMAGTGARIHVIDDSLDREALAQVAVELGGTIRERLYINEGAPRVAAFARANIDDVGLEVTAWRPATRADAALPAIDSSTYHPATLEQVEAAFAALVEPERCACGTTLAPDACGAQ